MGTDLSGKVSPFLSSCTNSNLRIAGDPPRIDAKGEMSSCEPTSKDHE
jgi:hypothetical protein